MPRRKSTKVYRARSVFGADNGCTGIDSIRLMIVQLYRMGFLLQEIVQIQVQVRQKSLSYVIYSRFCLVWRILLMVSMVSFGESFT